MSRKPASVCGAIIAALLSNVCIAGPVLTGASSDGTLYDIDAATGQVSNPRETGSSSVTGLAFDPNGNLFVQTGQFGTNAQALYRVVNTETGQSELVNDQTGIVGFDIEFNSTLGALFGLHGRDGELFTLDEQSGIGTRTGLTIGNAGPVASNAAGRSFAVLTGQDYIFGAGPHGEDRVLEINPLTGAIVTQWVLDVDMTYASSTFVDNTLYILDQAPGANGTLYAFDTFSGTLSAVNTVAVDEQIVALAYVPEPVTCILLLVSTPAAFALMRRRR